MVLPRALHHRERGTGRLGWDGRGLLQVNSHTHLHDAEKLDLQRQLSRVYAALTRFGQAWLPRPSEEGVDGAARGLLSRLYEEAEWATLGEGTPPLGERWRGGKVYYAVADEVIEEPVERFFDRLVVVRDRLHTLEACISAHPHVAPDEADGMGGYIRRCYGSLTTFNVLFRDRADYFTSTR